MKPSTECYAWLASGDCTVVDGMMTSGNLDGLMVSTLDQNVRNVIFISTLGAIFVIFITP